MCNTNIKVHHKQRKIEKKIHLRQSSVCSEQNIDPSPKNIFTTVGCNSRDIVPVGLGSIQTHLQASGDGSGEEEPDSGSNDRAKEETTATSLEVKEDPEDCTGLKLQVIFVFFSFS